MISKGQQSLFHLLFSCIIHDNEATIFYTTTYGTENRSRSNGRKTVRVAMDGKSFASERDQKTTIFANCGFLLCRGEIIYYYISPLKILTTNSNSTTSSTSLHQYINITTPYQISSTKSKRTYQSFLSGRVTDNKLEKHILVTLIPPHCFIPFSILCKQNPKVLEGVSTRNRRFKLQQLRSRDYKTFQEYCKQFGLTPPSTLEECLGTTTSTSTSKKEKAVTFENPNIEDTTLLAVPFTASIISPIQVSNMVPAPKNHFGSRMAANCKFFSETFLDSIVL
jgi:hypothetical protein